MRTAATDRGVAGRSLGAFAERVDALAREALARELALEGKPGLVTPSARGSHDDMDHLTFAASIDALAGYFGDCARLGAAACGFAALQARGRVAEQAMFAATGGVNTHKGAVFTLGLLAAAAGRRAVEPDGALEGLAGGLGHSIAAEWGAAILVAGAAPGADTRATHGAQLRRRYRLTGAREQAVSGFPVLFATTLPALDDALAREADDAAAGLHALVATIAVLDDTNLAHRGGLAGLRWAQREARFFVTAGSVFAPGSAAALEALGAAFAARWLSPGGSADLLAAAWFVRALRSETAMGRTGATVDAVWA
jgi:triphosphoribosyl-dephospho-CoA synthase